MNIDVIYRKHTAHISEVPGHHATGCTVTIRSGTEMVNQYTNSECVETNAKMAVDYIDSIAIEDVLDKNKDIVIQEVGYDIVIQKSDHDDDCWYIHIRTWSIDKVSENWNSKADTRANAIDKAISIIDRNLNNKAKQNT